jgi:hypothetical protein
MDVERAPSRGYAAALLAFLLLDLLLRLPDAVLQGWRALLLPSLEAVLLALVVCLHAWLLGGKGRWALLAVSAVLLLFLLCFRVADALLPVFFDRRLALKSDLGYLPALYGLLRDTLPRAIFVAGLILIPAALVAMGFGLAKLLGLLHRSFRHPWPRWIFLAFALLASAAAFVPPARVYSSSSLPRVREELSSWALAGRRQRERQIELRQKAEEAGRSLKPLERLEGRNVFLFIMESYGYTLYSEPAHFNLAKPFLEAAEARLARAGYRIVSNFLSSPAFGGNSWLADSTLAAGVRIADQAAYDALLASPIKPMAAWFNEAGYLTVNSMPATTSSWPEGDFFGFQKKYYFRDFGYQGPNLKWAPMTDQFAVHVIHRNEVAAATRPLFVQFVMISGHFPFNLIPSYFEDWSELGDGKIYAREGSVRALPITPGAATAGARGYVEAMEYQLTTVSEYLARFLTDRSLVVVVGDHQPYSGITGQGKLRSVPIHVLSRDASVLEPFLARGYTPGLVPRQPPPHDGMESFLPHLLADFSAGAEGTRSGSGPNLPPR